MVQSNWRAKAVCATDEYSEKWTSYKMDDVDYAKNGCARCKVRVECLVTTLANDSFIGVIAGMSELDFLMETWHEAEDEDESNWRTDDSTLSKIVRQIR